MRNAASNRRKRLVGSAQALEHDAEVAQHDAFEPHVAELAREDEGGFRRCFGFVEATLQDLQHAQVAQGVAFELAMASLASDRQGFFVMDSRFFQTPKLGIHGY